MALQFSVVIDRKIAPTLQDLTLDLPIVGSNQTLWKYLPFLEGGKRTEVIKTWAVHWSFSRQGVSARPHSY